MFLEACLYSIPDLPGRVRPSWPGSQQTEEKGAQGLCRVAGKFTLTAPSLSCRFKPKYSTLDGEELACS